MAPQHRQDLLAFVVHPAYTVLISSKQMAIFLLSVTLAHLSSSIGLWLSSEGSWPAYMLQDEAVLMRSQLLGAGAVTLSAQLLTCKAVKAVQLRRASPAEVQVRLAGREDQRCCTYCGHGTGQVSMKAPLSMCRRL